MSPSIFQLILLNILISLSHCSICVARDLSTTTPPTGYISSQLTSTIFISNSVIQPVTWFVTIQVDCAKGSVSDGHGSCYEITTCLPGYLADKQGKCILSETETAKTTLAA